MDGDRRNQVVAFADWKERQADYPIDVWELDRRAMVRDRMHRRILWACVVFLTAWCYGLWWVAP